MNIILDEVDTELYRLLATKTLQVSRPEKGKKSWTLKPGSPDNGLDKNIYKSMEMDHFKYENTCENKEMLFSQILFY